MSTFEMLAVTVVALLPGALYVFATERQTGIVRSGLADRTLRVTAVSALCHWALAPLTCWAFVDVWRTGRLTRHPVPWSLWWLPAPYLLLPLLLGTAVGIGFRRRRRWALVLYGRTPEPRAWDAFFSHAPSAWLRIRLKDAAAGNHGWIIGVYGRDRYGRLDSRASGYPEAQDLYLADTVECDEQGRFVLGPGNRPKLRNAGLLVSWQEISHIEVIRGETHAGP
ncbi:DUF6338 family protein [Streptomyces sp. NPDC048281]|uniref:DUF6338 family protein n=1 Tax=Streptomyces sp. NPDC048281 TaxID=3154715 RepID=UPI003414AE8F